ncbi:MAG: hypothetical protein ACYTFV_03720 [Planctomycetota bacterium]|jgi:hypothetical protein
MGLRNAVARASRARPPATPPAPKVRSGLLSMDPGAKKVGLAVFQDGLLLDAGTVVAGSDSATERAVHAWLSFRGYSWASFTATVCERMHLRPGKTKYDADLKRVERTRKRFKWSRTYNPTQWKGSISKTVHHRRCREVLTPAEAAIWDTLSHDARDAVGIGLFHLKRIKRGGLPGPRKAQ